MIVFFPLIGFPLIKCHWIDYVLVACKVC